MRTLAAVTLFALSTTAFAASFDCKLAKSPREKAICASPELSRADSDLAAKYKALLTKLSPEAATLIRADQRAWLAYLTKACAPGLTAERANLSDCLVGEYKLRSTDLDTKALPDGQLLYTRAAYFALPSKSTDDPVDVGPGVGIGNYAWPQIDQPNTQQAAFNQAAAAILLDDNGASFYPNTTSLREVTYPYTLQQVTWTLGPANTHLVTVYFKLFFKGYGGAHPNTFDTSFNWSIDENRELESSDILDESKRWKRKLQPMILSALRKDKDRAFYFLDKKWVAKGIASGLANTREWTLDRTGLTIQFAQYEVAAYAAGMPQVHLSWQQLQPFLRVGFDPGKLPAPLPRKDD